MIKDGVEYKKCPQCKRLCLALEIKTGICKDCRIENLEKENEQLKQKIEQMKCCALCKFLSFDYADLFCNVKDEYVVANAVCEKWEQGK